MYYISVERNIKLAVYDINPGGRQTIVLLHGWPFCAQIFEYQQHLLIYAGFRIIALDFRGFGNSDIPAHGYSYHQMAKDLYVIIKKLKLTSFILAAHSTGAAAAVRYLTQYAAYGVTRLCLLSAPLPALYPTDFTECGIPKETLISYIKTLSVDRPCFLQNFSGRLLHNSHSTEFINWLYNLMLTSSHLATINISLSFLEENCHTDLSQITLPTAIFHGKQDKIFPYDLAIAQHRLIKNSELFSFENSGHLIQYDELPVFNQHFINWLLSP